MSEKIVKSVLVVDDDPDICDVLQMILESYGYRVITAENGAIALQKLRGGENPSVILLDLMMPCMDGHQFRDEQLRDDRLAAIPVIVLSAGGDVAAKSAAMGVEGMAKPVDLDTLLAKIEHYDYPGDSEA